MSFYDEYQKMKTVKCTPSPRMQVPMKVTKKARTKGTEGLNIDIKSQRINSPVNKMAGSLPVSSGLTVDFKSKW